MYVTLVIAYFFSGGISKSSQVIFKVPKLKKSFICINPSRGHLKLKKISCIAEFHIQKIHARKFFVSKVLTIIHSFLHIECMLV